MSKDPTRAIALSQKACDGGDFEACHNLANKYGEGKFVPLNRRAAKVLYEKACQAGIQESCSNLAELYDPGIDGVRDQELAIRLYAAICEL